jgi:hypothetical protein
MLYGQALASRNMSEELRTIFEAVVGVVNYVKNSPLRGRLFANLCDGMEAEHTVLLYYCETRWLSLAKVLHRMFSTEKKTIFSGSNNNVDAYMCYSDDFIQKLACLIDVFEKLRNL